MADAEAPLTARSPRTLPQKRRHLALAAAAAALVGIGFGASTVLAPPQEAKPVPIKSSEPSPLFAPTPDQLLNLTITPVSTMTFRSETVTDGYIAVDDDLSTPVYSPFSGRVTKILAKLGDKVKKGQPLMTVEASESVQVQSELITAKAQFNLAATNEKRQHELYEAEGAALRDWQQSQVDFATAEAQLTAARNRLHIFGKTDAEIAKLEQMPSVPAMNSESVVGAPIGGTVVLRQVGLGQYVQAGSANPVFSIGDLSKVWLIANVRETDASAVHLGDAVEVRVLAFPDRVFKATISYVAPAIDPSTRRLAVRADVEDRDSLLKPQMFAQFTILNGNEGLALGIPPGGIIYEAQTARVWVENPNGTLTPRDIRTGRSNGGMVEIVSGLNRGDKVVTGGALFIDRAAAASE